MIVWVVFQWVLLLGVLFPIALFLRSYKQGRVALACCVILVFGLIWAVGQQLENTFAIYWPDETVLLRADLLFYIGTCILGPACTFLAWSYTGKHYLYGRKLTVTLLFAPAVLLLISFITNDYHHLFYYDSSYATSGYSVFWYCFMVYCYGCITYACITMIRYKLDMGGSRPVFLLLLCFLSPVAANVANMILNDPKLEFTPVAYCVLVLAIYLIVLSSRPFSLAPIAAKIVFEDIGYPLHITRAGGVVWENQIQRVPGREYEEKETALEDGNTLYISTDVSEFVQALSNLQAQSLVLEETRLLLEEQEGQLAKQIAIAEEVTASKARATLMSQLNEQVRGILLTMLSAAELLFENPHKEGIEENRQRAVRALAVVRRIVHSVKRGGEPV